MTLDLELLRSALPGYEIGRELGRGAFGVVLEGRHVQLDREVAIKQLPRAFAADAEVRSRFVAEARCLAALDHPHVVSVFDFVEKDGLCLLVMAKLTGGTVWSRFTTEGVSPQQACAIGIATCSGLHYAHQNDVLHRDVKPENLMFSGEGVLKVTDFGIAKVLSGQRTMATRAGEVLGTPVYMSPEQARGRDLTPATDIYATGTLLYELLAGKLPFPELDDVVAMLYQRVHEPPVPLRESAPSIPGPVADAVMRSLATAPEERYATAEEFAVAIAEAATACWGREWLDASGVRVLGTEALEASLRTSGPAPSQSFPSVPPPAEQVVRAEVDSHIRGASVTDMELADLVPVEDVVQPPRAPTTEVASSLALLLAAVAVAFLGLGGSGTAAAPEQGSVLVQGADPARTSRIEVDLTDPLEVVLARPPRPEEQVEMEFRLADVSVGSVQAPVESSGTGSRAVLDASGLRYVVAGTTPTVLRTRTGEQETQVASFLVEPKGSAWLSAPGIGALAAGLFVVAYAESLLRSLRRGRKRLVGALGLVLLGMLAGLVLVVISWVVGASAPSMVTAVVAAVLGAGAGTAAGLAAVRLGRRRRFRAAAGPGRITRPAAGGSASASPGP